MDDRVYRPEDPMYIKIHSYEDTVTWESPHHDTSLSDMFDKLKGLLVSIGYAPDSIDSCIVEIAEEINSRREDNCEVP